MYIFMHALTHHTRTHTQTLGNDFIYVTSMASLSQVIL